MADNSGDNLLNCASGCNRSSALPPELQVPRFKWRKDGGCGNPIIFLRVKTPLGTYSGIQIDLSPLTEAGIDRTGAPDGSRAGSPPLLGIASF